MYCPSSWFHYLQLGYQHYYFQCHLLFELPNIIEIGPFPKNSRKLMENLPNNIFASMDDFLIPEEGKPLGSGSFGIVRKGIHKMTGKVYAIKIVQLNENMNEPQMLLLSREISIHYQLNHPHIVKLWAVLEQNDKIYMIMDYAENGNLFNYLNKRKSIPEADSYRIFYQVLDAIEYMHKFDVFHRDLKPENILLDHHFNVKLCDFGWVADQINRKRTTFCGTYEYMAPEMVQEVPYNYKIDIWALGILLYELNHGKAPFPAESAPMIKQKFEKGVYEIKETLSQEFKNLIVGILQFEPSKRFQIQDIKKSSWVKKYKMQHIQSICSSVMRNLPSAKDNPSQCGSNTIKLLSKDERHLDQTKHKRYRKKYRTLEQEDLYCITQNLKVSKHASTKENKQVKTNQEITKESEIREQHKEHKDVGLRSVINKDKEKSKEKEREREREKEREKQRQKDRERQKKQQGKKKKTAAGSRTHLRTGTQTSELLHKKLSKIIFQQKLKLYQDDGKKKQASKRN